MVYVKSFIGANCTLKPQKSSEDCDVIIVNYNAGDLLVDCVLSAFAADCNIGVRALTSRYLLFLNPDSVLEPDALSEMSKVLDSSESIGMVGGLLRNLDGSEQAGARRVFPTPKRAFMRAFGLSQFTKFFPSMFSDFLLHTEPLPSEAILVEAISGACMLVKREAVDEGGLWDEGYFLHCEDLDWCMRFWQKGWKILFVPDAKLTHIEQDHAASVAAFLSNGTNIKVCCGFIVNSSDSNILAC